MSTDNRHLAQPPRDCLTCEDCGTVLVASWPGSEWTRCLECKQKRGERPMSTTPEITMADAVEAYAEPNAESIVDVIHPATGLTWVNGESFEQVQARYPRAERVVFADWLKAKATRQQTPIVWERSGEATYLEMLEILPPAMWVGTEFLVGEPTDHCCVTGAPRFQAYGKCRGVYLASSRPITMAELRSERNTGHVHLSEAEESEMDAADHAHERILGA